jgi:hypothetical protein
METSDVNLHIFAIPIGLVGIEWTSIVLFVMSRRKAFRDSASSATASVIGIKQGPSFRNQLRLLIPVGGGQQVEFVFEQPITRARVNTMDYISSQRNDELEVGDEISILYDLLKPGGGRDTRQALPLISPGVLVPLLNSLSVVVAGVTMIVIELMT